MKKTSAICLSLLIGWASALYSQGAPAAPAAPDPTEQSEKAGREQLKKITGSLKYQHGEINIRNGLATIRVPAEFSYLGPEDAQTVITKIWGNPASSGRPLGMLVPSSVGVADAEGWAVIIQYEEDGYISDKDAAKIDYNDLLKDMQKAVSENSEERAKQGYPPIELVGWATPPRYDAASKKMYWAKELKFGDSAEHTLNYNIRMLGRRGVLTLNAVASMSQLESIEKVAPDILAMVEFKQGNRYADFNPSSDKVATYGLAALITGGVLAKAGFFKVLLVGALAAKKFIIIGLMAMGGYLKKFFGKKE